MERKLAHIEKVLTATPIEGADRIESVQILGWTTVVKKSEFSIGQKVIFCEVDCILPEGNPHFEFMRDKKFRIKTCRLRGALSQGLVFPLSILPEGNYEVGEDVSEILGIKKYEPPIDVRLCGDNKGNFPWYTPKTDEIRCVDGNTIVETDLGPKTIRDIVDNHLQCKVLSLNTETEELEYQPITDFSESDNNNDWYKLELEDGKCIIATSEHYIYLSQYRCYRQVKDLVENDIVVVK